MLAAQVLPDAIPSSDGVDRKRRSRWSWRAMLKLGVPVFAVVLAGFASAPAVTGVTIPHYTAYTYTAKVGVKGGLTMTNTLSGSYNGDMVQESESGSYSIDGTIHSLLFFSGKLPKGVGKSWNGYSQAVVNGSWSDQGTTWVDIDNNVTAPFTCNGTINLAVAPGGMELSWKRSGSTLNFTLASSQSELEEVGSDACPNDSEVGWLQATDPTVYVTQFTLPASQIGRKTISLQASGPLAENRQFFLENCASATGTNCNLTWQGTVQFTRARIMKL